MKLEIPGQIFEKYSNIKFRENRSSVNRAVQCRQTGEEEERRTDMTKPTDAYRNFANTPRNVTKFPNKPTTIMRDFSLPSPSK